MPILTPDITLAQIRYVPTALKLQLDHYYQAHRGNKQAVARHTHQHLQTLQADSARPTKMKTLAQRRMQELPILMRVAPTMLQQRRTQLRKSHANPIHQSASLCRQSAFGVASRSLSMANQPLGVASQDYWTA